MDGPEDLPLILGTPDDGHAEAADTGQVEGAPPVLVEAVPALPLARRR